MMRGGVERELCSLAWVCSLTWAGGAGVGGGVLGGCALAPLPPPPATCQCDRPVQRCGLHISTLGF
jgi:hypothetical protein